MGICGVQRMTLAIGLIIEDTLEWCWPLHLESCLWPVQPVDPGIF